MAVAQGELLERERELAGFWQRRSPAWTWIRAACRCSCTARRAPARRRSSRVSAQSTERRPVFSGAHASRSSRPALSVQFLDIPQDAAGRPTQDARPAAGALPYEVASEARSRELAARADRHPRRGRRPLGGRSDPGRAALSLARAPERSPGPRRGHVPRRRARADASAFGRSSESLRRRAAQCASPCHRSRRRRWALLAAGHSVDPKELYRRTSGNPFFVGEVLAAPATEIPGSVRDAVFARMARLDPRARRLLDAVAVAPPRAELWLLEGVAAESIAALDECLASGMLRLEDHAVAFRHDSRNSRSKNRSTRIAEPELHRSALSELRVPSGRRRGSWHGSRTTPRLPGMPRPCFEARSRSRSTGGFSRRAT